VNGDPMPPRKKQPVAHSGPTVEELVGGTPPPAVTQLARRVEADGGAVLARYREPLNGAWLLLVMLPIDKVSPTPFQRELSATHVKRLETVIPRVGRFLDPLVAVAAEEGYWTPNGMHRLEAMRRLGARALVALLVPETELAYRILALNTEKAHNLKDKSLEVVRMADALVAAGQGRRHESEWSFEFEEPAFLTIGRCYEDSGRFAGGAYMPVVRRCEAFLERPLREAIALRKKRAARLLELDAGVSQRVAELKAAGLESAYLKPFVVARINPLRFSRARKDGPADFDATLDKMLAAVERFDAGMIKAKDLAAAAAIAGAAAGAEE
jgi:ParB family chromosome partitioning protein